MSDEKITLDSLERDMRHSIRDDYWDVHCRIPHGDDDNLHELIDGLVPVYNADRAKLLADCPNLAYAIEDAGLIDTSDGIDIFQVLGVAIYSHLHSKADELTQHGGDYYKPAARFLEDAAGFKEGDLLCFNCMDVHLPQVEHPIHTLQVEPADEHDICKECEFETEYCHD